MSVILKQLREDLELLQMGELRKRAAQNFGLKLVQTDSKEDIINKIVGVASKQNFAEVAKGDVPEPGWTRVRVHPITGKPKFPFYSQVNGYQCWIPFNVEVDVPHKIVGVLNDAVEMRVVTDEMGNRSDVFEQSYPFTIIAATPGSDPRPGMEVARERKLAAKRQFAEINGFWPKDSEMREMARSRNQAELLSDVLRDDSSK